MASYKGLFDPVLISPAISATFETPLTVRPLERSDYAKGFLDCLRVLTYIGDISEERFNQRYDWMNTQAKGGYYILVIDDGTRIVGTGALIVERKLSVHIHDLGIVGHIEEVSILKDQQGKKLGLKLLNALDDVAKNIGCYKSILNCSEINEGFYVKCGYKRQSLEMAHYFEDGKSGYEQG
ncbi:Phosphoglucosamine transacetylase [Hyphodiscus hymeniophilus]|uniref:Glucosamine 6-phosphate N-acetyltransferase n=1 Tax=Hyphodiscus hymeniophilus TaxID=353542 RepID=A0A9P6VG79_9HELO|nr:Phosphoglucosamine transacetylase [Hyphodiscus hymeniophilus]